MIRVTLQQPALAAYRVPVFETLARRSGVKLTVLYGDVAGFTNVPPGDFVARHVPMRRRRFGTHSLLWHDAQWDSATRCQCDVLIVNWDLHFVSLLPTITRARAARVPIVLWGHGYSKRENSWRRHARWAAGRYANAVLFYDRRTAERCIRAGFNPQAVFVAPNTLDQSEIQKRRSKWLNASQKLTLFKREHGLLGRPTVLFVSRLQTDNRVDLLLRAAAHLARNGAGPRWVVVGDGPERTHLQEQARELGVSRDILWVGATYEEELLAPFFLTADLFCYPANIGLSLLHAFGYGLPVVTSDRREAHNPEICALRPGVNGLLYRDGDARELARTIEGALADRTALEAMAREAHRTATEQFTLAKMVDGIDAAIRYCATLVGLV